MPEMVHPPTVIDVLTMVAGLGGFVLGCLWDRHIAPRLPWHRHDETVDLDFVDDDQEVAA